MAWGIEFTPRAAKAFRKLDKPVQVRVRNFLREVAALDDPRSRGKALVATKSGLWRWRVGDYRLVAEIVDHTVVIVVLDLGHRSTVYRE